MKLLVIDIKQFANFLTALRTAAGSRGRSLHDILREIHGGLVLFEHQEFHLVQDALQLSMNNYLDETD